MNALAPQRQQRILEEVRRRGGVRVSDLVDLLGVSDMTIRRDLDVLARRGLLHKVHGGATASIDHATDEPGFAAKSGRELQEKTAMARAAAELVEPGTAVGLSAGTTTWALARFLVNVPRLTVVTNSIPVAEVFYASGGTDQTVVLTGGVRTPSDALVGPVAMNTLRSLHLDQLFMGVHGMDLVRGYTTPNLVEAETNRALIDSARQLVVLADHTKWGVVGLSTFATLEETHVLITDSRLPVPVQELLAERVHRLVLTDADADEEPGAARGRGTERMKRTSALLADGREIIYFDDTDDAVRELDDPRDLPEALTASEIRHDVLLDEWVAVASHRQTRTHLPPTDECPLCPSRAGHHTEIPSPDYDVVVFENRFPSFAENVPDVDPWLDSAHLVARRPGRGRCEVVCFTSDHDVIVRRPDTGSRADRDGGLGRPHPRRSRASMLSSRSSSSRTAARRSA